MSNSETPLWKIMDEALLAEIGNVSVDLTEREYIEMPIPREALAASIRAVVSWIGANWERRGITNTDAFLVSRSLDAEANRAEAGE